MQKFYLKNVLTKLLYQSVSPVVVFCFYQQFRLVNDLQVLQDQGCYEKAEPSAINSCREADGAKRWETPPITWPPFYNDPSHNRSCHQKVMGPEAHKESQML